FKVSNPADTNANQFPAISGKTIVWQRAGSTDDILGAKLLDPSEVDVTYPNGGESVEAGTSMTITWTSTGPVDNVLIEFSSDGGASWVDVNTVPNTGSYLWDPVADVESTNCLVAVTNVDDPTAYDESDGVFELYRIPNSITVIAPNGGEQFLAGKPMDIVWTSFGPITNVKIEFSDNDGVHWQTVVASTPNDEAFTWTAAPDVNSQACSIRITDAEDPATSDISDAALTVFQCDSNLTADLTGDCFVDLGDYAEFARQWLDCGNPYDPSWCLSQ
ncbi:MAG: GPI anchored serine-threonine rich family protein, partial [Planctomycetota bacterium]